jgi:plasmid stability protein
MSSTITVRDIDPGDKSWLKREARHVGVSMEGFVRRLIREKREKAERRMTPSEAFKRYFGPEHGVELPPPEHHGYRPVEFADESKT